MSILKSSLLTLLIFLLFQGCTIKSTSSVSNESNFESQEFLTARASNDEIPTPLVNSKPTISIKENDIIKNESISAPSITNKSPEKKSTKDIKKEIKKEIKQLKQAAKTKGDGGKSQIIALVLAACIGALGIHRFYLGYIGIGILQLITGGCCGIWTLIDIIRIITGDLKPKNGDYTEKI